MRKVLTYLFLILILFLLVAIFIADYWYFKNFYHSLIITAILITNYNIFIQGKSNKTLINILRKWLQL
jgi:hypothetical protein